MTSVLVLDHSGSDEWKHSRREVRLHCEAERTIGQPIVRAQHLVRVV